MTSTNVIFINNANIATWGSKILKRLPKENKVLPQRIAKRVLKANNYLLKFYLYFNLIKKIIKIEDRR